MGELPRESNQLVEQQVYSRIGADGFERLCRAFYARVANDDILGSMYPEKDLAKAEARLREFLVFRFGGPNDYIQHRGHPRLRLRHASFAIDQSARDRWMQLMNQSLDEVQLPADVRAVLVGLFEHVATFLINR